MKRESVAIKKDSSRIVPCPKWLQKRMRANLTSAAKNKVSPERAKRASEIIKAINRKARKPGLYPDRVGRPVVARTTQSRAQDT